MRGANDHLFFQNHGFQQKLAIPPSAVGLGRSQLTPPRDVIRDGSIRARVASRHAALDVAPHPAPTRASRLRSTAFGRDDCLPAASSLLVRVCSRPAPSSIPASSSIELAVRAVRWCRPGTRSGARGVARATLEYLVSTALLAGTGLFYAASLSVEPARELLARRAGKPRLGGEEGERER